MTAGDEIPTGAKVVVVDVLTPDTVAVEPACGNRKDRRCLTSLLLPSPDRRGSWIFWLWLVVIVARVVAASLSLHRHGLMLKQYKRCPSNRVLVIYGSRARRGGHLRPRRAHGSSCPLIQDYDWLSLEPMQIEIPLRGALSMENIRVNVPSVFTVAIGTTPELMQNAAIRLLGAELRGDREAGRGHHLRPAAPGDRLDADRGHQPRPREVPGQHPEVAGAGAARRSAWC